MTYSKIHQAFSERLESSDALTNPEKYLGPNYQDVLNFWIYVEGLSDQEREEMGQLYWALDRNVRFSVEDAAHAAATEVVGEDFRIAACWVAFAITGRLVFGHATYELIGHHMLLDQNRSLTFLPLCIKS